MTARANTDQSLFERRGLESIGRLLADTRSRPLGGDLQNRLAASYRQTKDPRLERQLVEANLRLVVKIARDLDRSRGRQLEDLVQEGCLGLVQAVRRFDPDKGAQFSTYAGLWVRAFIMRYIMDNVRLVRAVRTRAERAAFFRGVVGASEVSFEAPVGPGGCQLSEVLAGTAPDAETLVERAELMDKLRAETAALQAKVSGRDATILKERLLAADPGPWSRVAQHLALSGERVRQIEGKLVAAIRARFGEAAAPGEVAAAA